jgi:hypothetical protein
VPDSILPTENEGDGEEDTDNEHMDVLVELYEERTHKRHC